MAKCDKHQRYSCWDPSCRTDNAGEVSIDVTGGIGIGVGGGLTIDPTDGGLGIKIAPGVSLGF